MHFDVIIIGGGPAGLSAALVLARSCRSVVVCDDHHPRNASARALHNYLSRDGIAPRELLSLSREELQRYGVRFAEGEVIEAKCESPEGARTEFSVILRNGARILSRKLLIATGVRDVLPKIDGFDEYYGRGIHHCPYCDAYEYRGRPLVALGEGNPAAGLALSLRTWSSEVIVCSNGSTPDKEHLAVLSANGIRFVGQRILKIEGSNGAARCLERIVFSDHTSVDCAAIFFNTGEVQHSPLATSLGCRTTQHEQIQTTDRQGTGVHGVFLAGDADGDVQFVIVAAAEGATAAVAINRELQEEDRRDGEPPPPL